MERPSRVPWTPDFPRLFRGDSYRFELGLRPTDPARWFQWTESDPGVLAERGRALAEPSGRGWYWTDDAALALDATWSRFPAGGPERGSGPSAGRTLACAWEPDFLWLRRRGDGEFHFVGGAVCFPSSWDPAEKLGRPMTFIHGPVPGLNESLGRRIAVFLERLSPGQPVARENWGLAAVPDRDLHPVRHRPGLDATATLSSTWLRVEHQVLQALPEADAILFGIALTVHRLDEVVAAPGVAMALARQLETMPEDIAAYKGLTQARDGLVRELRGRAN